MKVGNQSNRLRETRDGSPSPPQTDRSKSPHTRRPGRTQSPTYLVNTEARSSQSSQRPITLHSEDSGGRSHTAKPILSGACGAPGPPTPSARPQSTPRARDPFPRLYHAFEAITQKNGGVASQEHLAVWNRASRLSETDPDLERLVTRFEQEAAIGGDGTESP